MNALMWKASQSPRQLYTFPVALRQLLFIVKRPCSPLNDGINLQLLRLKKRKHWREEEGERRARQEGVGAT